jgi:hypothetical protein
MRDPEEVTSNTAPIDGDGQTGFEKRKIELMMKRQNKVQRIDGCYRWTPASRLGALM